MLVDVVLEKDEALVEVEYDYEEEVDAVDFTGGGVVVEVDVDLEEKVEEEIVVEQTEVVEETVVVENNDQNLNLTIVEWTMRL